MLRWWTVLPLKNSPWAYGLGSDNLRWNSESLGIALKWLEVIPQKFMPSSKDMIGYRQDNKFVGVVNVLALDMLQQVIETGEITDKTRSEALPIFQGSVPHASKIDVRPVRTPISIKPAKR
jgi:hypothetical protein